MESENAKFKVGDWLVHKDGVGVTCCITQIHAPHYYLTNNNSFIKFVEEDNYRPWTIQDAKAGDVLYTPKGCGVEGIFLIEGWKQVDGTGRTLCSDIGYRVEDDEIIAGGLGAIWWKGVIDPFYPATKEQRYLFFEKIRENGFEYDSKKNRYIKKEYQRNMLLLLTVFGII